MNYSVFEKEVKISINIIKMAESFQLQSGDAIARFGGRRFAKRAMSAFRFYDEIPA
jgi:hypothetical protein